MKADFQYVEVATHIFPDLEVDPLDHSRPLDYHEITDNLEDPSDVETYIERVPDPNRTLGGGHMNTSDCLICKKPAAFFGVFYPTISFSKRIGAKPGKTRLVGYGMCDVCMENPTMPDQVEDLILKALQVQ